MTSLPIWCHFLQLKKKTQKTQKTRRGQRAFWLFIILYNTRKKTLMLVFLGLQETTTSLSACHHFLASFPHL